MSNIHPKDRDLLTQCQNLLAVICRIPEDNSEQLPPSLASRFEEIEDLRLNVMDRLQGVDIENN